jgi:hypothetical protein
MESLISKHSPPVLPDSEPSSAQPCRDGFQGLDAPERALRAEILHRAYSIWVSKGRMENSHVADWLEAEAEVLSESLAGRDPKAPNRL